MNEIINKYKAGEITIEEANAQLKEAGAGYYLKGLTDDERSEKKTMEDIAGYFDTGRAFTKPLPQTPDMRRNTALAGLTVIQKVASGLFAVNYDEGGYAVKASRMK